MRSTPRRRAAGCLRGQPGARAPPGQIRDLAKRLAAQSPCTCRGLRRVPLRSAIGAHRYRHRRRRVGRLRRRRQVRLRSTFMYLGWLCGADPDDDAALRAASGLELLHAFALLQDDVMDDSPLRRAARPRTSSSGAGTALTGFPVPPSGSAHPCPSWMGGSVPGLGRADDAGERRFVRGAGRARRTDDDMRIELAVGQSPTSPTTREHNRIWRWFDVARRPATTPCAVHWRSARRWPAANR